MPEDADQRLVLERRGIGLDRDVVFVVDAEANLGWPDPVYGEELYAATFVAPRLSFYQRLLPMAEAVVKTARIKG